MSESKDFLLAQLEKDLSSLGEEELNEDWSLPISVEQTKTTSTEVNNTALENDPDWLMFTLGFQELGKSLHLDPVLTAREELNRPVPFQPDPLSIENDSMPLSDEARISQTVNSDVSQHPFEIVELLDSLIESIEYLALFEQDLAISRLKEKDVLSESTSRFSTKPFDEVSPLLIPEEIHDDPKEDLPHVPENEEKKLESEELILDQYKIKRSLEEMENIYEIKVREEHLRQQQLREEKLREKEERKKRRKEQHLKALKENKAVS